MKMKQPFRVNEEKKKIIVLCIIKLKFADQSCFLINMKMEPQSRPWFFHFFLSFFTPAIIL